ncbi:nuclear transport factor 2 family protein [Streptomyces paradoxus]|uniref:nuclear transport factor 2 family protein n=1 Tax=Streptomyces paradoxus TaxID=66375 RepID=UPI0037D35E7F
MALPTVLFELRCWSEARAALPGDLSKRQSLVLGGTSPVDGQSRMRRSTSGWPWGQTGSPEARSRRVRYAHSCLRPEAPRRSAQAFAAVAARDADAFGALFAGDYVVEMPYVKPEPLRADGRTAATEFARQAFQALGIEMTITSVHDLADGNLIAEYTGKLTVLPTGPSFTNHYVGLWRFAGGKIASTRE